jgi:chromosomal replication initiation ATPase DnaA
MSRPTLNQYLRAVTAMTQTTVGEITGPSRKRHLVRIRQAIWLLVYENGNGLISMTEMGRRMNRDHGSISHGVSEANELMRTSPAFRAFVNSLRREALLVMGRDQREAARLMGAVHAQHE